MTTIVAHDPAGGPPTTVDLAQNTATTMDHGGRIVKMDLGIGDVHLDKALANFCAGFKLQDGIADEVCPVVPVDFASDKYRTWEKDDIFAGAQDLLIAPDGSVREFSPSVLTGSYSTVGYGAKTVIRPETLANADAPLKVEQQSMRMALSKLKLAREARVATLLTTSGNFAYTKSLGSTQKWMDAAGGAAGNASDPVKDLYEIMDKSLMPVTHIVMSEKLFHGFMLNPAVKAYYQNKQGLAGTFTPEQATAGLLFPGLPQIIVAKMKNKNTSTGAYGNAWDETKCVLLHRESSLPVDGETIMNATTMRWNGGNIGDAQQVGGFIVRSYTNPFRGARGAREIVISHYDAEVSVTTYVGGLITGCSQLG